MRPLFCSLRTARTSRRQFDRPTPARERYGGAPSIDRSRDAAFVGVASHEKVLGLDRTGPRRGVEREGRAGAELGIDGAVGGHRHRTRVVRAVPHVDGHRPGRGPTWPPSSIVVAQTGAEELSNEGASRKPQQRSFGVAVITPRWMFVLAAATSPRVRRPAGPTGDATTPENRTDIGGAMIRTRLSHAAGQDARAARGPRRRSPTPCGVQSVRKRVQCDR